MHISTHYSSNPSKNTQVSLITSQTKVSILVNNMSTSKDSNSPEPRNSSRPIPPKASSNWGWGPFTAKKATTSTSPVYPPASRPSSPPASPPAPATPVAAKPKLQSQEETHQDVPGGFPFTVTEPAESVRGAPPTEAVSPETPELGDEERGKQLDEFGLEEQATTAQDIEGSNEGGPKTKPPTAPERDSEKRSDEIQKPEICEKTKGADDIDLVKTDDSEAQDSLSPPVRCDIAPLQQSLPEASNPPSSPLSAESNAQLAENDNKDFTEPLKNVSETDFALVDNAAKEVLPAQDAKNHEATAPEPEMEGELLSSETQSRRTSVSSEPKPLKKIDLAMPDTPRKSTATSSGHSTPKSTHHAIASRSAEAHDGEGRPTRKRNSVAFLDPGHEPVEAQPAVKENEEKEVPSGAKEDDSSKDILPTNRKDSVASGLSRREEVRRKFSLAIESAMRGRAKSFLGQGDSSEASESAGSSSRKQSAIEPAVEPSDQKRSTTAGLGEYQPSRKSSTASEPDADKSSPKPDAGKGNRKPLTTVKSVLGLASRKKSTSSESGDGQQSRKQSTETETEAGITSQEQFVAAEPEADLPSRKQSTASGKTSGSPSRKQSIASGRTASPASRKQSTASEGATSSPSRKQSTASEGTAILPSRKQSTTTVYQSNPSTRRQSTATVPEAGQSSRKQSVETPPGLDAVSQRHSAEAVTAGSPSSRKQSMTTEPEADQSSRKSSTALRSETDQLSPKSAKAVSVDSASSKKRSDADTPIKINLSRVNTPKINVIQATEDRSEEGTPITPDVPKAPDEGKPAKKIIVPVPSSRNESVTIVLVEKIPVDDSSDQSVTDAPESSRESTKSTCKSPENKVDSPETGNKPHKAEEPTLRKESSVSIGTKSKFQEALPSSEPQNNINSISSPKKAQDSPVHQPSMEQIQISPPELEPNEEGPAPSHPRPRIYRRVRSGVVRTPVLNVFVGRLLAEQTRPILKALGRGADPSEALIGGGSSQAPSRMD